VKLNNEPIEEPKEDAELDNNYRAELVARLAIAPYARYKGLDDAEGSVEPADVMHELLADLRHLCDREGVDFAVCDRKAYASYREERAHWGPASGDPLGAQEQIN
jgi:hypothetical protein